jgi:hypothetical protein
MQAMSNYSKEHNEQIEQMRNSMKAVNMMSEPQVVDQKTWDEKVNAEAPKEIVKEAVQIIGDNPEEMMQLMSILKNAGLNPQQGQMDQAPHEEETEESDYENEPDPNFPDPEDHMLKRAKHGDLARTNNTGDNPLMDDGEMLEQMKQDLRNLYAEVK